MIGGGGRTGPPSNRAIAVRRELGGTTVMPATVTLLLGPTASSVPVSVAPKPTVTFPSPLNVASSFPSGLRRASAKSPPAAPLT